ncbi:MAG: YfiR family protein [Verrucomicrobia bacterium]|nr:YfiR family protein [Verrucomicrobiota bacterium]
MLLAAAALSPARLPAEVSKEYQVKAAFLYNFTKFVEWPTQHFAHEERPILIGILGRNPFGEELDKILRGRKVAGRELEVKVLASPEEAKTVDVLFVCEGEEQRLAGLWQPLLKAGVLTVGESGRFGELGGMVVFLLEGDKVRFSINLGQAEQAQLKLSAQLLKLATAVRRNP